MPQGRLGGIGFEVANQIRDRCGLDSRVLVLGHLQRGGSPTPFDRILGTRFGVAAVELAAEGNLGHMVCLKCGEISSVPIREAIAHERLVDPNGQKVRAAKSLGISFGD